jgi:GrpB-like predicted nucleotidyltransferase (UPF0157 family)
MYQRRPEDAGDATEAIATATATEFGSERVRYATSPRRGEPPDFPVRDRDGRHVSSLSLSEVLVRLPASRDEYVFVAAEIRAQAKQWVERERERILTEALAQTDEREEVNR